MAKNKNNIDEHKLIASLAVFGELCNREKDFYDIIEALIIGIFQIDNIIYPETIDGIYSSINKHYRLDIPFAVVEKTLHKMKKKGLLKQDDEENWVIENKVFFEKDNNNLKEELRSIEEVNKKIETKLIEYVENKIKDKLDENKKINLRNEFIEYIRFDNSYGIYGVYISSFIISNERNDEITKFIDEVKLGEILYEGLLYFPDNINQTTWNTQLTIFLDTEILFHAVEYNGKLFKQMFDDFYSFIIHINSKSLNKLGRKLISLKYFKETRKEVDLYFAKATDIVRRRVPAREAMKVIVKGCEVPNDVIEKKAKFEQELNEKGIEEYSYDEPLNKKYNLENNDWLKELNHTLLNKISDPDEKDKKANEIANTLKLFSTLNMLRKGENKEDFEKSIALIITGSANVLRIAEYVTNKLKSELTNNDYVNPFAINIQFATNKLWYKTQRGFKVIKDKPKSFSNVAKARIALSTIFNKSVSAKYKELTEKSKTGTISSEDMQYHLNELMNFPIKPEEIHSDNTDDFLDFMSGNSVEKRQNEFEIYKRDAEELKELKRKAEVQKKNEVEKDARRVEIISQIIYILSLVLVVPLYVVTISWVVYKIINYFGTEQYKPLEIFNSYIGLIGLIVPLIVGIVVYIRKKWNIKYKYFINKVCNKIYENCKRNLLNWIR